MNRVEGWCFSFYEPRRLLKDVQVTLLPAGRFALTDGEGRFEFTNIPSGAYQIVAQKGHFQSDTIEVTVAADSDISGQNFFLNGLPYIESKTFFSAHIDEIFPGEFFQATLAIVVNDSDGVGDINELHWQIPEIGYSKQFMATSRPDSFVVNMLDIEFPETNLAPLVEIGGLVRLTDLGGADYHEGPLFLKRIIQETPQIVAPAALDTTGAFPTLAWERLVLPFNFTFEIQLSRLLGGTPFLVFSQENIDENQQLLTVPDSLENGQYLWTLGVRDHLNNFSRSEEARFIVHQGE